MADHHALQEQLDSRDNMLFMYSIVPLHQYRFSTVRALYFSVNTPSCVSFGVFFFRFIVAGKSPTVTYFFQSRVARPIIKTNMSRQRTFTEQKDEACMVVNASVLVGMNVPRMFDRSHAFKLSIQI